MLVLSAVWLFPVLIQAVEEQEEVIEAQQKEIDGLKQLERVEAALKGLK